MPLGGIYRPCIVSIPVWPCTMQEYIGHIQPVYMYGFAQGRNTLALYIQYISIPGKTPFECYSNYICMALHLDLIYWQCIANIPVRPCTRQEYIGHIQQVQGRTALALYIQYRYVPGKDLSNIIASIFVWPITRVEYIGTAQATYLPGPEPGRNILALYSHYSYMAMHQGGIFWLHKALYHS